MSVLNKTNHIANGIKGNLLSLLAMNQYFKYVLASVAIIFGLFNCFFGSRFFRVYVTGTGAVAGFLLASWILELIHQISELEPSTSTIWITIISLVIIFASLANWIWKKVLLIAAAYGGYMIGSFICTVFDIASFTHLWYVTMLVQVACVISAMILLKMFEKLVSIILTASFGALLVTAGIDSFVETGYKTSLLRMFYYDLSLFEHVSSHAYYFIAGAVALTALGITCQLIFGERRKN